MTISCIQRVHMNLKVRREEHSNLNVEFEVMKKKTDWKYNVDEILSGCWHFQQQKKSP